MAKNDITGDEIKSKVNSKQYEDNYDKIFRKEKNSVGYPPLTPNQSVDNAVPESGTFEEWNEKRIDIIGSNGNTGEHY